MKWHDDNRERFEEHCAMSAIDLGFILPGPDEDEPATEILNRLVAKGHIRPTHYWEWTPEGKTEYEKIVAELREASAC